MVSGNNTEFEHYADSALTGLRNIYIEPVLPILAFCGGRHLLAQTHGAEIGPMGPWRADDTRPSGEQEISSGMRQEMGFRAVRVKQSNPLFSKLADEVTVFQTHYWEAKTVPSDFSVSAESDLCEIEALQHRAAPVFGTQFHPEEHDERHPDGRQIICNFFQYVGLSR